MFVNYIKKNFLLIIALVMPIPIFIFTLGKYYGFYYDNHQFNLLSLDLLENFNLFFYLGNTYSIHSTLYSYLAYPVFLIFGATDFSMELLSAFFHLLVIYACFKFGEKFFSKRIGLIFALLVSIAPIYLINIYTWNEYSLIALLNILSIYFFISAFEEISRIKLIISAALYSLSCFQAIYSLLLLPFFTIYAVIKSTMIQRNNGLEGRFLTLKRNKLINFIWYLFSSLAFLYLIFILEAMFVELPYRFLYYLGVLFFVFFLAMLMKKLPESSIGRILSFSFLFFRIIIVYLLLIDLFVQLDMNFFGHRFGYYRDTTFAGGFNIRPPFIFNGFDIRILGKQIYLSVFSSLFAFNSTYTQISFNLSIILQTMVSYYKQCFPLSINIFFIAGVIGLLIDIAFKKCKNHKIGIMHIIALSWLLGASLSFVNSQQYHMLRIFILPMPYLFAALGVYYLSQYTALILDKITLLGTSRISLFTTIIFVFVLSLNQFIFLADNIFRKYRNDKLHSNYFKLFHGWPYGRSYKEVGEFLLRDAPLKENDKFRSIFIYTIAADTSQGICSLFYNNIEWYTRNKIKILYDVKPISKIKYGSKESLRQYLNQLFIDYPDVGVIYFADFYDTKDNFSFFSKIHPDIPYHRIVNDDDALDYDCILYKFLRRESA